jgi:uncharacterized protein (TIGR02646 family)
MLRLPSRAFSAADEAYLLTRQNTVDAKPDHQAKVIKAKTMWDGKKSSQAGQTRFTSIKATLLTMCAGIEICTYCELNEATDIEHIYPKKLYPGKTFKSANYLLACGNCNTHHKKDKFSIFIPHRSNNETDVTCSRGVYNRPQNQDTLFINPRSENPMRLMKLDLVSPTFMYVPTAATGTRDYKRAKYTIELLGLNKRAALVEARRSASTYYLNQLRTYSLVEAAMDFPAIQAAFADDFQPIDITANFVAEKNRILGVIKTEFINYSQPTVWKEMVRQRINLARTNVLLNAVPAATGWA